MADIHTTEGQTGTHTTIVERRGGGGTGLIAIVLLIAVLIGGFYLFSTMGATNAKNDAVAGAAKSVGSAADKVGDAASGSTK
jgi:hypothetical protein